MDESARFWRQADLCPPEKLNFPITLVGAGAIGSAVALNLAKMGCSDIAVFDHDALELHNAPNQMCRPDRIGMNKAQALAELVDGLCGAKLKARPVKYVGQRLSEVVVLAVDSMEARRAAWRVAKKDSAVRLLLDARMGAEVGRLHSAAPQDPDSAKRYEATLYPPAKAERLPCSARAIVYCPSALAAFVAAMVKRYATGQPVPAEAYLDLANFMAAAG